MNLHKGYASATNTKYKVRRSFLTDERDRAELYTRQMLAGEINLEKYKQEISKTTMSPIFCGGQEEKQNK